MHFLPRSVLPVLLLAASLSVAAQNAPVTVQGAWARASVPGQSGTGAFMQLTARQPLALVGVATPAAGVAEVHEMKMEGDVMKMRAIPELPLAAGKAVALKPGGYHLMLMDLKAPLKAGATLPLTLRFRDAKGAVSTLDVSVPVAASAPGGAAGAGGAHHKH
jgi:copper(I)-binding protein